MPIGTAFHERTLPLCESLSYREWSGYYAVSSYEPHHEHEYNAIRNAAALIDISPLFKYRLTGKDATRLVDRVITFGADHFYISQSDKCGLVFGGDLDGYNSYAQRGNLPMIEHVMTAGMAMMPCLGRLRLLRHWAGIMDMTMDGSPIIARTPVQGLYHTLTHEIALSGTATERLEVPDE